jgi:hypothetical protein
MSNLLQTLRKASKLFWRRVDIMVGGDVPADPGRALGNHNGEADGVNARLLDRVRKILVQLRIEEHRGDYGCLAFLHSKPGLIEPFSSVRSVFSPVCSSVRSVLLEITSKTSDTPEMTSGAMVSEKRYGRPARGFSEGAGGDVDPSHDAA